MSFEKKLNRLEEIVEKMESGEIDLDQSLKLFEEGVKLSRQCSQDLGSAEKKVQVLMKSSGEDVVTEDFMVED